MKLMRRLFKYWWDLVKLRNLIFLFLSEINELSSQFNKLDYIIGFQSRWSTKYILLWLPCPHPQTVRAKMRTDNTGIILIAFQPVDCTHQNWLCGSKFPSLNQVRNSFHVHEKGKNFICVMVLQESFGLV